MAASLACSMAQNVYSVNVVGYVNVTLASSQFTCVANPLDATMGGTVANGNNINNLFQNMPDGSYIQVFDGVANDYTTTYTYYDGYGWDPNTGVNVPPGKAVMFYNTGASGQAVTFVGQVPQGAYSVGTITASQFSQIGSPVPIGGNITNSLDRVGMVPTDGDYVQLFSGPANDWTTTVTYYDGYGWDPLATEIAPAQGFFYYRTGSTYSWTSNFTVAP